MAVVDERYRHGSLHGTLLLEPESGEELFMLECREKLVKRASGRSARFRGCVDHQHQSRERHCGAGHSTLRAAPRWDTSLTANSSTLTGGYISQPGRSPTGSVGHRNVVTLPLSNWNQTSAARTAAAMR